MYCSSLAEVINPCVSWWRHQTETFSALLVIFFTGEFPSKRPVTRSFVFFDLNKRLCKQSLRRWLDTPSLSLWRHYDVLFCFCASGIPTTSMDVLSKAAIVCDVLHNKASARKVTSIATARSMRWLLVNPLWPSDAVWQHTSGSTMSKVMACCLMTPKP